MLSRIFRKNNVNIRTLSSQVIRYEKKKDVALIRLNTPDSKVNTLNINMQDEFKDIFSKIKNDEDIKSVVILSDKKDSFIAGADINMLTACKTEKELSELARKGHEMFDLIESGKPTVAAINGNCLGGGFELALSCSARIGTNNSKTVFGLPEVMLGLLPGSGGTQRLPRLIGLENALPLILTGRMVHVREALKNNLIDKVVEEDELEEEAIKMARGLTQKKINRNNFSLRRFFLESNFIGQQIVFEIARKNVMKQTYGNYIAPVYILDCIQDGYTYGEWVGYQKEITKFGKLGFTNTSKSLIHLYNSKNECSKNKFDKPDNPINNISIIGSGLMGSGIGKISINKAKTSLIDANEENMNKGYNGVLEHLEKQYKRGKLTQKEYDVNKSKFSGIIKNSDDYNKKIKDSDLVIEAIFEDKKIKQDLVQELEEIVNSYCIIATNTSAIPIREIASVSNNPDRIVGMHYFSPVEKMPLMEIIPHEGTSKETLSKVVDIGIRQGKVPIKVKDVPGFYVNRCLGPYMSETISLLMEGFNHSTGIVKKIDEAMKIFGFPVGPITLIDEVGLDIAQHVQETLAKDDTLVTRINTNSLLLKELVNSNILGKKNGNGFFVKGKKGRTLNKKLINKRKKHADPDGRDISVEEIQERLSGKFINEVLFCLQDGIIETPMDGDLGAVFGVGFPPFTGGPFKYMDTIGADKILNNLNKYNNLYGDSFKPCELLKEHVKDNRTFY